VYLVKNGKPDTLIPLFYQLQSENKTATMSPTVSFLNPSLETKIMSQLPDYVASAQPNSFENRAPWLTTTAATYAGIMLWFAFWANLPGAGGAAGGALSQGLLFAIGSLVIAAFICYVCFYHVPAMLGMKTGLPLYIVGTSTYGVEGGFFMPGFLMGCLQFGWLSVNGYFAGLGFALMAGFGVNSLVHLGLGVIWAVIAGFVGLKGIKYVSMVASYMPIIPIAALLCLFLCTVWGVFKFDPEKALNPGKVVASVVEPAIVPVVAEVQPIVADDADENAEDGAIETVVIVERVDNKPITPVETKKAAGFGLWGKGTLGSLAGQLGILSLICAYVTGFFATAGAAGCDFGSNNKDRNAVILGGLVGITGATIFTGAIALIAVAGAQGVLTGTDAPLNPYENMKLLMGGPLGGLFMFLLAVAAFPAACFSTLIASNSFRTTLPKVDPLISCGIGTGVACLLIVTTLAGKADFVFGFIGASFGPVCGAMMADYLLAGKKWAGPRAGYNLAGWISFGVGFLVGGLPLLFGGLASVIPCPPVSAFVVGFGLYWILAKAGLESKKLDMPQRIDS